MCTAATYYTKNNHFFGRNLDLEFSYNETVTITPRGYRFAFRHTEGPEKNLAIIGMAFVVDDYPLYYDAVNEAGLGAAGLNFPGNAHYEKPADGFKNIASFEVIPWILTQCKNTDEARELVKDMCITDTPFDPKLPPSPLHWMVADKEKSIVIEQTSEGLKVYENPVGVMTNNPTFDRQLFGLNNYMKLSAEEPENTFANDLVLDTYSRGMGAMGMPGDLSSASRFVKASFTRMNSRSDGTQAGDISQFFHILRSVEQQRGCVHIKDDLYEITIYSSCCDLDRGIYYYTTYDNHHINATDMHAYDLDDDKMVIFKLNDTLNIKF